MSRSPKLLVAWLGPKTRPHGQGNVPIFHTNPNTQFNPSIICHILGDALNGARIATLFWAGPRACGVSPVLFLSFHDMYQLPDITLKAILKE
jgi:hypothetical protein